MPQAAPVPQASPQKPPWDCQVSAPKSDQGYTVGEVFNFECHGSDPLTLKEPLAVVLDEKMHHSLVLLKANEIAAGKISYQATGYRPGEFKFPSVHVVDETGAGFFSQPFTLKVISVIDPQKKPEQPFGPISPLAMQWPVWVPFSAVVAVLVLIGWVLIFFRRRVQRKTLEKNIRKYQSPLGSYHQYSKDIRLLKRGVLFSATAKWTEEQIGAYLAKLDEIFRMYILREFVVPANKWPVKNIIKHMRSKDRSRFNTYGLAVVKAFKELERAQGQKASLTAMDCEQLTAICSLAIDAMWKAKMAASR